MKRKYSFILQAVVGTVLVCWCAGFPSGRSIDEIIAGSRTDAISFNFNRDMAGTVMRLELDMLIPVDQYLDLYDKRNTSALRSPQVSRLRRKAKRPLATRWPNKLIPYSMDSTAFSTRDKREILMAIKEWEDNTCITFRRATSADLNSIHFEDGDGCSSYVGMIHEKQEISLSDGCRYKGIIIHEIGHAVGFFHEQNRPDRDAHIIIKNENIVHSNLYENFEKYSWSTVATYGVPYDYQSVMHYGGTAFSGNGEYTIVTKDPAYQEIIGTREDLSFNDIKLANLMYSCSETCQSPVTCPEPGFLGKDCQCWCPGDPVTKCDETKAVTDRPSVTTTERTTLIPTTKAPIKPMPNPRTKTPKKTKKKGTNKCVETKRKSKVGKKGKPKLQKGKKCKETPRKNRTGVPSNKRGRKNRKSNRR